MLLKDLNQLLYSMEARRLSILLRAHALLHKKPKNYYREKSFKLNSYFASSPIMIDQLVLIAHLKASHSHYGIPLNQEGLGHLQTQLETIAEMKPLVMKGEYEFFFLRYLNMIMSDRQQFEKELGFDIFDAKDKEYFLIFDKAEYERVLKRSTLEYKQSQTWIQNLC